MLLFYQVAPIEMRLRLVVSLVCPLIYSVGAHGVVGVFGAPSVASIVGATDVSGAPLPLVSPCLLCCVGTRAGLVASVVIRAVWSVLFSVV